MRHANSGPGASRVGRAIIQRRGSRIQDPTEKYLRQHAEDYEAFETPVYALERMRSRARRSTSHGHAAHLRGDTSSDEAFNPLNIGLRRR